MAQISIITPMLLHLNPSEHRFFATGEGVSRYYPGGRSSHFLPLKNTGYPV
jgi:hypothetical protein